MAALLLGGCRPQLEAWDFTLGRYAVHDGALFDELVALVEADGAHRVEVDRVHGRFSVVPREASIWRYEVQVFREGWVVLRVVAHGLDPYPAMHERERADYGRLASILRDALDRSAEDRGEVVWEP